MPAESQLTYLHADHLNTAQIGTGDSSPPAPAPSVDDAVIWRLNSNAYGVAWETQNPDGDSVDVKMALRFPGQIYYGLGGLNYNYFRTYDTIAGRYLESDPIGLEGGFNTYGYAEQNPGLLIDPMGLSPRPGAVRMVGCNSRESTECRSQCAALGKQMESCKRVEKWALKRVSNTDAGWIASVYHWKKLNISCSCDEPTACEKNPVACTVIGLGVCGLILTPWPDDVLIPIILGAGGFSAAGQ